MRKTYKNVCPASIMAANMWKNSSKKVESDNNKNFYTKLYSNVLQLNGTYFINKPRNSYFL